MSLDNLITGLKLTRYFFLFKRVEKALGFKLYRWQKELIIGKAGNAPMERKCGFTTAHILRNLLAVDGEYYRDMPYVDELPTDYYRVKLFQDDRCLSPQNRDSACTLMRYEMWYYKELRKTAHILMKNGIKVRRILYALKYSKQI